MDVIIIQRRTDGPDRPVRTNGKRPNYQQILSNLPMSSCILLDDCDYQAFVLTISSQERILGNPVGFDNRKALGMAENSELINMSSNSFLKLSNLMQ